MSVGSTLLVRLAVCVLCLGICHQIFVESLGEKRYGQYCSGYVDRSCNQSLYLICVDKRCDCRNPATMVYDTTTGGCVTRLGKNCYQEGFFITNPKGYKDSTKFYQGTKYERKSPCGKNAICDEETKKCICQNPLDAGINGTCTQHPVGEFMCDFDHMICPGGTGLRCVDGTCQCRFPNLQYFNGTRCISRVEGPCSTDEESQLECTPFAECIRTGRHNQCVCSNGYTQNRQGLCVPGYGQRCNFGTQCGGEEDLLSCVDGVCRCPDDLHVYDSSQKRCRGLAGAFCRLDQTKRISDKHFCVNNAFCSPRMYGSVEGVCTCGTGYYETRMRSCDQQV